MRSGITGRYGLLMATCLTAFVAAGWQSSHASEGGADGTSRYLAEGRALLAKGDLKAAEIQLKNALREAPEDFDSRFELGLVYLGERAGPAAEGMFNNLWQRHDHLDRVLPKLADAYLMQGKTREILERIRSAKDFPVAAQAEIAVARAKAHLMQDQDDDAKREIDDALALQPDMPDALIVRALLLQKSKDYASAEQIIDQLLGKSPNNFEALTLKGDLRRRAGDPAGAMKFLDLAIQQRPGDSHVRLARASSLLALGRADEAKPDVDAVLKDNPAQPVGVLLHAYLLSRSGKYEDAFRALQPVAQQLAGLPAADALLAQLNIRLDHPEQAIDYAQRYVSETSSSPAAVHLLAMAYARKNAPSKVVEVLEPLVAQHPDDAQGQMLLGDAYAALGRYDAAARILAAAAKARPEDTDLRTRLDADRFRAGDQTAAVSDLAALVGNDPKATGRAGILLMALEMQKGQFDDAARVGDKLRAEQPTNPLPDYLLGLVHQVKGDPSAARQDYGSALNKRADFYPSADALARLDLAEGKQQDAQAVFERVLDADPKNVRAMEALSKFAASQGDIDKAVGLLEKAAAAAPKDLGPRLLEIDLLIARKKEPKALAVANGLNDAFPDNIAAMQALARAQWASGDRDAAAATFRRAAGLQPNSAMVQYRLGQVMAGLGRPADARSAYEAATRLDPKFLPAWRAIVLAQSAEHGVDQAIASAQALAGQDPSMADELKGDVYFQAKRYAEAESAYAEAAKRRPDRQLAINRWETLNKAGDQAAAQAILATWLQSHADDGEVRLVYAGALLAAKDRPSAIREYQAVLHQSPTNVVALNNLAWLYAQAGDRQAIDFARRAHGLAPLNPSISDTLAWLLVEQGGVDEGRRLLGVAHRQQPGNAEIAYHLAVALERSGEAAKAVEVLKPVVDGQPFDQQAEAKALYRKLTTAP